MFVSLLAGLRKNNSTIFTRFGENVAHGPRKKPLAFGGNDDDDGGGGDGGDDGNYRWRSSV